MNKSDMIRELKNSKLDLAKVWVLCGSAMVLHNLREITSDIDLGCSSEYFNELLKNNPPMKIWCNGDRSIDYAESIEIFEEWNINEVDYFEGIAISSISDLIVHKESLNREKDKKDLEVLYAKSLQNRSI